MLYKDITKDQIIEAVAAMSVMDVVELVSAMEEKFGVSAAAAVAVAAGPAEAAEEKTEFDVILKAAGANKVAVIKGADSTRSLASFRPRPVAPRTALITATLLAPAAFRITSNSVFSSAASTKLNST